MRPGSVTDSRNVFVPGESEDRAREGQESVIDAASTFDGLFRVGNHLRIEGEAKGEIQCEGTLTIAEGATVSAKIAAVNVVVAGIFTGEITCRERLQILPSGRVSGTIATGSLVIQEGALYEGELHMQTSIPTEDRAQPAKERDTIALPASRQRTGGTNGRSTEAAAEGES